MVMNKIESEKSVEKKLNSEIKRIGGLSIKLVATYFIGLPDRLCLLPKGRLFFVELKTTNKKPRKIQIAVHNKIISLGFDVYVIDSTEKIKSLIHRYE